VGNGSAWWTPVYEGLFDAKHCQAMGQAIWLYGWILMRAHAAQRKGSMAYNHDDAAAALHVSRSTVRNWFRTLQEHGYIDTRARHPHHLEVQVSNWRPVEEWRDARQLGEGPKIDTHKRDGPSECQSECQTQCQHADTLSISKKLESYLYPTGRSGDGPTNLAELFLAVLGRLKGTTNRAAALRHIFVLCFGDDDPPDYGYIAKVGKQVGGAGRLAEIMWQLSTKPPTGDVMAYILSVYGRKGKQRGTSERRQEADAVIEQFLAGGK